MYSVKGLLKSASHLFIKIIRGDLLMNIIITVVEIVIICQFTPSDIIKLKPL